VLQYLDGHDTAASYLGFVTLRPVAATPVGASILRIPADVGFIRCADEFPVNLAGHKLELTGVPFMQQDNAVGTCAQASIWMALRTMRKREGDRAHDPAQITGAATRYSISGRILPNRKGLTQPQVVEAIRAAGYSPHPIHFALGGDFTLEPSRALDVLKERWKGQPTDLGVLRLRTEEVFAELGIAGLTVDDVMAAFARPERMVGP
jgi:hypothetical protein